MDSSSRRQTQDQDSGVSKVTARKLKKRELDRKAQRVARERTKSRIQELESLVEQLKADAADPQVSNLTATLSRVTQQKNELENLIRSIDETIQRHTRQNSSLRPGSESRKVCLTDSDALINSPSGPGLVNEESNAAFPGDNFESPDALWHMLLPEIPQSTETQLTSIDQTADTLAEGWSLRGQPSPEEDHHHHHHDFTSSADIIVPRPEWPCDCVQTGASNTWRKANAALGKSTMLSPAQLAIEDFTSEDTPIRVILNGWDAAEEAGKSSVSWRKLREIDETCFSTCGDVERLGILRTMHLLIRYHGNPIPERCEQVPRWLWTRPSQTIPHSYAIDYFVWPGLRERFIFGQHRYCTNTFWQLFRQSIRLNWPLDLKDCYETEPDTGRYVFSAAFDNRLRDINTWRMTVDFFAQFPELTGDIPVYGSIAPCVAWSREERARYKRISEKEHGSACYIEQPGLRGDDDSAVVLTQNPGYATVFQGLAIEPNCSWPSI